MSDLRPEPIQITKRSGGKRKLLIAVALVAILAGGAGGGIVYMNSVTKRSVTQELQNITDRAAAEAQKAGATATFTYESVELQGGVLKSRAVIKNPRFEYKRATMFGAQEVSVLSTASALVDAASLKDRSVVVTLPDPILINVDGQDRFSLQSPTPPTVSVMPSVVDGINVTKRELKAPAGFTITSFKAGANGEDKTMIVAYDPEHTLVSQSSGDGTFEDTQISLTNVKLTAADESVNASSVILSTTDKPVEGKNNFTANISVTDLAYKTVAREGGPYSINLKAAGEYTVPKPGEHSKDMKLMLDDASFTAKDYSLAIKGSAASVENDPLPSGSADVDVKGIPALAKSNAFGEYTEILVAALEQINGAPLGETADMNFAIKREPMGTVSIGKTTFEQVVGLVMTKSAEQAARAAAVTPVTEAPAAAMDTTTPSPESTDAPASGAPAAPASSAPAVAPAEPAPAVPAAPAPVQ